MVCDGIAGLAFGCEAGEVVPPPIAVHPLTGKEDVSANPMSSAYADFFQGSRELTECVSTVQVYPQSTPSSSPPNSAHPTTPANSETA